MMIYLVTVIPYYDHCFSRYTRAEFLKIIDPYYDNYCFVNIFVADIIMF